MDDEPVDPWAVPPPQGAAPREPLPEPAPPSGPGLGAVAAVTVAAALASAALLAWALVGAPAGSGGADPDDPLIGTWVLATRGADGCMSVEERRADGTMVAWATSGERVEGRWRAETGPLRRRLDWTFEHDNGEPDCTGSSHDESGARHTAWVWVGEDGTARFYRAEADEEPGMVWRRR